MIPNSMNSGIIIFFIELLTIAFFLVRFEIEFQILILRKTKNQRGGGDMTELNYQTKQRTVILNFLTANAGETYDVDSLYDTLVKRGEKVSRTTVYRMLKKLEEEKSIVSFFDASRKRTLFRFNPNPDAGENRLLFDPCHGSRRETLRPDRDYQPRENRRRRNARRNPPNRAGRRQP